MNELCHFSLDSSENRCSNLSDRETFSAIPTDAETFFDSR